MEGISKILCHLLKANLVRGIFSFLLCGIYLSGAFEETTVMNNTSE